MQSERKSTNATASSVVPRIMVACVVDGDCCMRKRVGKFFIG